MKQQNLSFSLAPNKVRREGMWVCSPEYLTDGLNHLLVALRLEYQRVNNIFFYPWVSQTSDF